MLSSKRSKATLYRFQWQSYLILAVLVAVHITFFAIMAIMMNRLKQYVLVRAMVGWG